LAASSCHSLAQRRSALERVCERLLKENKQLHEMMQASQLPDSSQNQIISYVVVLQ